MGRANRERRRMKEKVRKRAHTPSGGRPGDAGPSFFDFTGFAPSLEDEVEALFLATMRARDGQDEAAAARSVAALVRNDSPERRRALLRVLDRHLKSLIGQLWKSGWQPADLLRIATRRLKPGHLRLLRAGMAAELTGYPPGTIAERWSAQLAEGQVEVWWPPDQTAVSACAAGDPEGWPGFVGMVVELLNLLSFLPRLEILDPPPGKALPQASARRAGVDERMLARVRALLAKAESTNFPAEAETFTAGAQALMARHSIDHALLTAAGRAPADKPTARRIGVDNPYEAPKASLLDAIASANSCRSVWTKALGYCTVIGYPTDLDTVEILFTSMLVQATAALGREGARIDRSGRSRTRTFRQSFLLSYASRIRERLTETSREQTQAAASEPGHGNLLPVLASRAGAVEEATSAIFPRLTQHHAGSAWDSEGWSSGRAAADLATLTPAEQVTG